MTIRTLVWIDAIAALTAGIIFLLFRSGLSVLFGLPSKLLLVLSFIALAYSLLSGTMTWKRLYSKQFVTILAAANFLYAVTVAILLIAYFDTATIWCKVYFALEVLVIAVLAALEWRTTR